MSQALPIREVFPDFVRWAFGKWDGDKRVKWTPMGTILLDGKGGVEMMDEDTREWRTMRSMERYDLTKLFPEREMPSNLAWCMPPPEYYRPATEPKWIEENRRRVAAGV